MSNVTAQAASHAAAKNNLYPASFSDLQQKALTSKDPSVVYVAMQTQYILQNNKAMSRTQLKNLRQQLNIS